MYGTVSLALFFLSLLVDKLMAQFENTVADFSMTEVVYVAGLNDQQRVISFCVQSMSVFKSRDGRTRIQASFTLQSNQEQQVPFCPFGEQQTDAENQVLRFKYRQL